MKHYNVTKIKLFLFDVAGIATVAKFAWSEIVHLFR